MSTNAQLITICFLIAGAFAPSFIHETGRFFGVMVPLAIAVELGRRQGRCEK